MWIEIEIEIHHGSTRDPLLEAETKTREEDERGSRESRSVLPLVDPSIAPCIRAEILPGSFQQGAGFYELRCAVHRPRVYCSWNDDSVERQGGATINIDDNRVPVFRRSRLKTDACAIYLSERSNATRRGEARCRGAPRGFTRSIIWSVRTSERSIVGRQEWPTWSVEQTRSIPREDALVGDPLAGPETDDRAHRVSR